MKSLFPFRTVTPAVLLLLAVTGVTRAAEPVSFVREVVPVLTKLGCNSGSCHGSFQGRGGFRLSLLGFDPVADFESIVTEARGRRLFPASPDSSLLLLKATGQMAHGGKKRLEVGSESHRVLRDWVSQGASGRGVSATVVRLELNFTLAELKAGETRSLQLRAVWSGGEVQDATRLALYESTRDTVAVVDKFGTIEGRGPGRAAVTVRYMGQVAAVPVTIAFGPPATFEFPAANFIDTRLAAEWRSLGLVPASLSSDAEFLRRVSLDLTGTLPTPGEVRQFLADSSAAKRAKLIDQLLDRAEYADYWALKWADLLRAHRRHLGDKGLASFNTWLRSALRDNRPADRMARELLTAQGNLYTSGPVAFYYVDRTPVELGETMAQVFLGVRLQCAQCHHHPFEVWSQDDYFGMAAFFARVKRKDTGENGQFGGAQSVRMDTVGTFAHPKTGKPVAPQPLGGKALNPDDPADPRVSLGEWLTARDNPYFARNIVNRYWGHLFGRGLVESIDDLRATNPATFPALFDELAADFTNHGYDLKHLLRTICNSRAYQLACETRPTRDADGEFVTHRRPRPLPAEVVLDAVSQASGVPETFDKMPSGTRAIALPDPAVLSYFLDSFGRPKRLTACECERGGRPDLTQILHLMNGETLQKKVASPDGRLAKLFATKQSDDEIIDELYLATLSRTPTDAERQAIRPRLAAAPSRREGFEDLLWALLNAAEFVFNH